jgi:hypothetical protein
MRKIKAIASSSAYSIQGEIDSWISKNPNASIISVSGSQSSSQHGSREFVTYILYENKEDMEKSLLNS